MREDKADTHSRVAKHAGFSLHAGVMAEAHQRDKLERLCRYFSRPSVSEKRLWLTVNGNIRYELKMPYRNGTTQVIFELLDFIAKLAALVPKPRINLIRFHGVFAPNSKHRVDVTPAKRGKKPDKPVRPITKSSLCLKTSTPTLPAATVAGGTTYIQRIIIRDFTAKTIEIRTTWAGPTVKIAV